MNKREYILTSQLKFDNIIHFPTQDSEELRRTKKRLNLLDCNKTSLCMLKDRKNPFKCPCYTKCKANEKFIKLFL